MSDSEREDMEMTNEVPEFDKKKENEEEDLSGDGGVKKKIFRKSPRSWDKPENGSEIICHYVGKLLDGTVFDSSKERDEPFKFKLGKGQVIKGWDIAFKTMGKFEQALLTIKPEYAYGSREMGKIPANSTLQFEVELIDFIKEEDVSPNKDRSILKKLLKEGEDWQQPKEDEVVVIDYVLRLQEGGEIIEERKGLRFVVGAEEVIPGLDIAIQKFRLRERSLIIVAPSQGYGAAGDEARKIPPNAQLWYEVELVQWEREKDSWKMSNDEKMEAAGKTKNEGNALFKQGKYQRAIKKYKKAVEFVQYDSSFNDVEKAKAKELRLPCHLNAALCHLKLKEFDSTLEDCKKVFEIDKENVKGLFRRGQAYVAMDKWDEGMADFNKARDKAKDDATLKEIDLEINKLKRKMAEYEQKEKQMFSKMYGVLF